MTSFNYLFQALCIFALQTYLLYNSHQMHQNQPFEENHRNRAKCFISNGEANIKIKMQPKSLSMKVPLNWEINKIKCILCSAIPKLEFNMISLFHDNQLLSGSLTLQQVLDLDDDSQCHLQSQYVLTFQKQQSKLLQFQKYYACKMLPVLTSLKQSPYQPLLHPKYHALQAQILEMSQMSGLNIKANLQNLLNLRTLLNNINRNGLQQQQAAQRVDNPQNVDNAMEVGAFGAGNLLGLPGNNRNIFEWIMFLVFKVFQIMILWQLFQVIFTYINKWHVIVIAFIAIFYFYIEYYQKQRNQQPEARQQQPQQNQILRQPPQNLENHKQKINEAEVNAILEDVQNETFKVKDRCQRISEQNQENVNKISQVEESVEQRQRQQNQTFSKQQNSSQSINKVLVFMVQNSCLFVQGLIGFLMSLFPNWNIQLHHNLLRRPFDFVDSFVDSWLVPKELSNSREKKE